MEVTKTKSVTVTIPDIGLRVDICGDDAAVMIGDDKAKYCDTNDLYVAVEQLMDELRAHAGWESGPSGTVRWSDRDNCKLDNGPINLAPGVLKGEGL